MFSIMSSFFLSVYCLTFHDVLTQKTFFLTSLIYQGNLWPRNEIYLTQVLLLLKLENVGDVRF
jgi:hypothetical protein